MGSNGLRCGLNLFADLIGREPDPVVIDALDEYLMALSNLCDQVGIGEVSDNVVNKVWTHGDQFTSVGPHSPGLALLERSWMKLAIQKGASSIDVCVLREALCATSGRAEMIHADLHSMLWKCRITECNNPAPGHLAFLDVATGLSSVSALLAVGSVLALPAGTDDAVARDNARDAVGRLMADGLTWILLEFAVQTHLPTVSTNLLRMRVLGALGVHVDELELAPYSVHNHLISDVMISNWFAFARSKVSEGSEDRLSCDYLRDTCCAYFGAQTWTELLKVSSMRLAIEEIRFACLLMCILELVDRNGRSAASYLVPWDGFMASGPGRRT